MSSRSSSFPRALLLASVALIAGCSAGPDFKQPDKPKEQGYTPETLDTQTAGAPGVHGGAAQTIEPGRDIPGDWWTLFRSQELSALVEEAMRGNPDIDAAQASLRQANELLYSQQGALFPTISAKGSAVNQRVNGAQSGIDSPAVQFGVTSASLNIAYSPDLFGGVRRQVEAQGAQADYQRFQLEATYLTLTSNVVVAAVNLASLRAQIAATQQVIRLQTDALNLVQTQFNLGGAAQSDVLQQQANLRATQATLPPLQKALAQQRNGLMRLLGRSPTEDAGQGLRLDTLHLPEELPLSLPSQLVDQRPDVRSAVAQLHTASANIGVAVSAQMPQFNITGALGFTSLGFQTMFSPASTVWNLGISLAQTLFDGGQLDHNRKAAIAAYDKAAAQYRGTVLSAFQDVANALRAIQADADGLRAAVAAEQTAAASLNLSQQQYQFGAVNYLALLQAQQTYQNAVLSRVKAQATRYSDTAALFQALGGGWWNRNDVAPQSKGKPGVFTLPPIDQLHLPRAGH
ncbi:MAG: efflux transporter outer membrane subunit [Proteobacteria bacterium]|nr:efflux transporter outer membrane subunit [Pseudomonadota bacterium]